MSNEAERDILKIYDGSRPREEELFEGPSHVNYLALSLAAVFGFLTIWFAIALVNAENQRNALANNMCRDPVFNTGIDKKCMVTVQSRDHWWEHLWYGATHVRPSPEAQSRR